MLSSVSFNLDNLYRGISTVSSYLASTIEEVNEFSKGIFNGARKLSRYCFKNSSLDITLDEYQRQRSQKALANAKTRNNAQSLDELTNYHESIRYKKNNTNGIFLSHKASGKEQKKLVILLMGNLQNPGMSEQEAGILKIYNQLKREDKHDLLLMRVGSASADIKHKLYLSNDPSLNTDVVYQHIQNLIEDRCNCQGSFSKDKKPKSIDIIGFSWGGGVEKKLEKQWKKLTGLNQARTVTIDAIKYGCNNFGDELCEKPNYSSQHLDIYQNNDYMLNGEAMRVKRDCDFFINVNEIDKSCPGHSAIDDSEAVITTVLNYINN
jgi:hypothetical protein